MFCKRDIVIINFPFSDIVNSKKRPVLVLGEKGDDLIVCAITSNPNIKGAPLAFESKPLPLKSTIKYWQIQTIIKSRAEKKAATITKECYSKAIEKINQLFELQ